MNMQAILTETVRLSTGIQDAKPRPGQSALARDVEAAMGDNSHVSAVGPTGLGKSFCLLAPAVWVAAERGERTIISTESLSLQAQIMDKDA
ncbi:MAG: ATP-dependent DNA helicase, partial [Acidobacteria bacterium]|nr:ATP-dependent DNA helicase [Acidobacteriota bacterium]